MRHYQRLIPAFLCAFLAASRANAQQPPVGVEWPCPECLGGKVCFRASAEVTECRASQGPQFPRLGPGNDALLTNTTGLIQQNPKDSNAYVSRAEVYLTPSPDGGKPPLENLNLAVKDLESALKIDPKNFYALHDYGHAAYLLNHDDIAIAEFTKAIAVNPRGSGRSHLGRGWAYYEECKFDEALKDFHEAARLDASLQSSAATPQQIAAKKQECADLTAGMQSDADNPARQNPRPNFDAFYQRQEANRRAGDAHASGNNDAARIIREQKHLP
jgi:tetratricopeptide (TPR) repeat protein